jgi:hypothetical protein
MKKTMEKFEALALSGKQATQVIGGKWIYSEGRGGFNDKNDNGRLDEGESWYFIYETHVK